VRNVYLDTNVPSFLTTTREDPASTVRRELTQRFWRAHAPKYRLFVSELVIAELTGADWPGRDEALAAIDTLLRLPVTTEVRRATDAYIRARVMPDNARGDAAHYACASVHGMDIVLTWNIRHLANPGKTERLAALNRRLGLSTPVVCTPEALLEEDSDDR